MIPLKFVPKRSINNTPALVQIMAWHRPDDTLGPMMVNLLTHICVTRPQWVKCFNDWTILKVLECRSSSQKEIGFTGKLHLLPNGITIHIIHHLDHYKIVENRSNRGCLLENNYKHPWSINTLWMKNELAKISHQQCENINHLMRNNISAISSLTTSRFKSNKTHYGPVTP